MSKISFDAKGLYFFDYEIEALRVAGFVFDKLKKKRGQKRRVFRVMKNPEPIECTREIENYIKNVLPLKMGPICIIDNNINIEGREFNE